MLSWPSVHYRGVLQKSYNLLPRLGLGKWNNEGLRTNFGGKWAHLFDIRFCRVWPPFSTWHDVEDSEDQGPAEWNYYGNPGGYHCDLELFNLPASWSTCWKRQEWVAEVFTSCTTRPQRAPIAGAVGLSWMCFTAVFGFWGLKKRARFWILFAWQFGRSLPTGQRWTFSLRRLQSWVLSYSYI